MQHPWCSKHHLKGFALLQFASLFLFRDDIINTHHRPGIISVGAIERLDVLKFKHVSLYKGFSNLLVGPRDEQLVVMISFLRQPGGEVDRSF